MADTVGSAPVFVVLRVPARSLWRFHALLRRGFRVETALPCPLQDLLCDRLAIPSAYVTERIQTVFLDGRAVDDVAAAEVADGAVVALSAAMPGLVGATLRKGGTLTNLRSHLSYRKTGDQERAERVGRVTVKLFNLVCDELAPEVLGRGVLFPAGVFQNFFNASGTDLTADLEAVRINGAPLAAEDLSAHMPPDAPVCLTVGTTG